jgi:predicted permease
VIREVGYALRSLRRTPWYSITVVSVIALSMALSATVFAIVDGVLFIPLGYGSPDRLFALTPGFSKLPDYVRPLAAVSPADVAAWREAVPDLPMTAFTSNDFKSIGPNASAPSASVDAQFFNVFGVQPIGGGFVAADFLARAPVEPAVVTHDFWIRQLGADSAVIGRSLVGKSGTGIRIVGVLPKTFAFPTNSFAPDVITPLVLPNPQSAGRFVSVWLRVPDGESAVGLAARLTVAARVHAAAVPPVSAPPNLPERTRILRGPFDNIRLEPIRQTLTARFRQSAWIVFGGAATLVLLACLNVTGLAAARVQDRWREFALRRALGAGVRDLVRLLAVESALLVIAGTVVGVWLAHVLLRATLSVMSRTTYFLKVPEIDGRVLVLTSLTAAGCVLLVSLLPSRAAWQTNLRTRQERIASRRWFGGRPILIGQIALSFLMTIAGTLVTGSLVRVWAQPTGFEPSQTALLQISTPKGMTVAGIEEFLASIRRVTGVAYAGGVAHPILERAFNGSEFDKPAGAIDTPVSLEQGTFPIESMPVTFGYLDAAGMRAIDGRLPTEVEFSSGNPVAVVSELVAHQYLPGRRAVGQTLRHEGVMFTVVGVVRDARYMSLDMEMQGAIYWPVGAAPRPFISNLLVSGTASGSFRLHDVTAVVAASCPDCVLYKAEMLNDTLAASIRQRRFNAWLFSSFGAASLVIVGTGILGLVAMTTSRRTKEIGIRLALGSTPTGIVRQIVWEQMFTVACGLLSGGLIAAWAVKFVAAYLYKTAAYDGWAWVTAVASVVLVAIGGSVIPSLRGSRVDPIRALRVD